jgi:hypothetical protein
MSETAAKISAAPTRAIPSAKSAAPRSMPAKLSPAWPAVSLSPLPTVQPAQQPTGGEPLQPGIRSRLEGSFGVDLRTVRVHSDPGAQKTAHTLSARAFTFGQNIFLGSGERPNDLRLMAHETSHVIQQQASPAIQRWSSQQSDRFEQEAQQASSATMLGQTFAVQERTNHPRVQRLGLSDILDGLADLAANVPGFTLLTVIIGRNPINMRTVQRNFTNILRGFMGLIPGGEILFQVLNRYGVVERLGNWASDQVNTLGITYDYLRRRFTAFTDSLGWSDILSPGDVWRRARDIFSEPITRIRDFIVRLIAQAITWLKETFMQPLSEFCRQIPGYTLVTVLLGRDPFTNTPVARTALNVVRAFAEFIPGGTEKVNQLVESRALQRAYEWFIQETQARNLTWDRVVGTFAQAWNSLRLEDVLHPIETLQRIGNIFRPLMGDLVSFAGAALMKLLELIFEAVMGAGGARVLAILKRARDTFMTIIRNPVGFLRNLLGAVGQGVRQFMTNILRHLQQGVIAWLTGPVARAGIQMPERWDLPGIIWFVLQILGLTWERVRQKLVRLIGEPAMAMLESAFRLVQDIRRVGLVQALRDRVTEFFGQLRDAALGSIRSFIQQRLVMAGITQLLSLLNPVGAVIQAIIKTYTTIQFFIQRINQILDLVESIVNSIAAIASGAIGQAANFVERTMARTIPIILDFLARFIGLGDVGAHVQRTIQSLQARVDQMLDRAVEWIRTMAQRVMSAGQNLVRRVFNWAFARRSFTAPNGETHTISIQEQNNEPTLIIQTSPKALRIFLNDYVAARGGLSSLPAAKRALVNQALDIANNRIAPLLRSINTAVRGGATDDAVQPQRQQVLGHYTELTNTLSSLIGNDVSLATMTERYRLEGIPGTYASIPKITGDQLTADHQPQASILVWLDQQTYFSTAANMRRRAANRAHAGYAINLHRIRHEAGRTYGNDGNTTKQAFIAAFTGSLSANPLVADKRREAIRRVKIELQADVNWMRALVARPRTNAVWSDINSLSIPDADKERLVENIKARILRGESILAAQDLDSLTN